MRRVMHRQHDAGHDLHAQHEGENAAERPPVIQIARRRIGDEGRIDEAGDRQPPLHPFHERALRLVGRMSAHGRTLCLFGLGFADPDLGIGDELVGRQREVKRRRALPDAAGGIVLRAVARAEPAVVIALVRQRNATEMGADADQDQPLLVAGFDARGIGRPGRAALPVTSCARLISCGVRWKMKIGLLRQNTLMISPG